MAAVQPATHLQIPRVLDGTVLAFAVGMPSPNSIVRTMLAALAVTTVALSGGQSEAGVLKFTTQRRPASRTQYRPETVQAAAAFLKGTTQMGPEQVFFAGQAAHKSRNPKDKLLAAQHLWAYVIAPHASEDSRFVFKSWFENEVCVARNHDTVEFGELPRVGVLDLANRQKVVRGPSDGPFLTVTEYRKHVAEQGRLMRASFLGSTWQNLANPFARIPPNAKGQYKELVDLYNELAQEFLSNPKAPKMIELEQEIARLEQEHEYAVTHRDKGFAFDTGITGGGPFTYKLQFKTLVTSDRDNHIQKDRE